MDTQTTVSNCLHGDLGFAGLCDAGEMGMLRFYGVSGRGGGEVRREFGYLGPKLGF